ncbi:MAG TPA: zf-HC2 domain-containing protein [Gemmatimonadales bacterium]|nr:zf-HC2 domain-containing protein [Gemmatimonadales bacterium]
MSDQWTDRLSEYLDGELPPDRRAELEAHLRHCVACGAVLADLKRIVTRAQGLEDRAPERDLWPGVAARIGAAAPGSRRARPSGAPRRRWSFSLPQLAAAGIALMALSGGAAWLLRPLGRVPLASQPSPAATRWEARQLPGQGDGGVLAVAARPRGERSYDAAVADLERVLEAGRGRLDTATVRVIVRNLATIDSAIAQAQRAVAADSANLYLNSHLAETMRRKLELLRQAATLVSSVS